MMRPVLILAAVLVYAAPARANECNAGGAHVQATDVPLGCPVRVIVQPFESYTPAVTVTRFDTHTGQPFTTDVTGTVAREPDVQVPVEEYRYHGCDLLDDGPEPRTYNVYAIALHDVEIGDELAPSQVYDARPHIVAAGPCPAFAAPSLSCAEPVQGCADAGGGGVADPVSPDPGGGCSTGHATSLGLALVMLALLRRR